MNFCIYLTHPGLFYFMGKRGQSTVIGRRGS
jgi:hypothetical protein